jgi:hypothetical protein
MERKNIKLNKKKNAHLLLSEVKENNLRVKNFG